MERDIIGMVLVAQSVLALRSIYKHIVEMIWHFLQIHPHISHTSLVISPLKSLIQEQVQTLREHNIKAYGIHEGIEKTDVDGKHIII